MIGKTLAHYEITDQLGKGGMGEVYRAHDTKLDREVAIKTLPPEFAEDPDRLARFEREAKLLASLNHPNIAAIYGLEEHEGSRFLVLELVEGDTLGDRLKRGAIPVEESLRLALQIADALKAAHESGVIHRDLKPDNIKVSEEGNVKVLDFGLAKAMAADGTDAAVSNSPTLSMAATQAGVILGTAAYMSPEQAKGRTVDRRADVWAFGCVLYEMLSGRQSFGASDVTESLAAVIRSEPEWSTLPANLNPRLRETVERCLEKPVEKRYQDIGDVKNDIERVLADPGGVIPAAAVLQTTPQSKLPWVAALVLGVVVAGIVGWRFGPRDPPPVSRFSQILPEGQEFTRAARTVLALSPDGSRLVYVGDEQLYSRRLDTLESIAIPGTDDDPAAPFFSPDGEWIGYWSGDDSQLKKIAVGGGVPIPLTDTPIPTGVPSWGTDDTIVFTLARAGVLQVSANGGTPAELIPVTNAGQPQILPDGETVLVTIGRFQIALVSPDFAEPKDLFPGERARYVPTGHLVYVAEGELFAVPFDLRTLDVAGGPVSLVEGVGGAQFAISASGTLAYIPGTPSTLRTRNLVLSDREGNPEVLPVLARLYRFPRFSPDGRHVAVQVEDDNGSDIWIYDIETTIFDQLTFDGGQRPLWSPDGSEVTFLNGNELWTIRSDIPDAPAALPGTDIDGNLGPGSWSPDGDVLLFASEAGIHAWRQDNVSETAEVLVPRPNDGLVRDPEFSPDGTRFVYSSNEIGTWELYVSEYPVGLGRQRITTDTGGLGAVWVRDEGALIYEEQDEFGLVSIEVTAGPTLGRGNPVTLFNRDAVLDTYTQGRRNYDVSADGQRILGIMEEGVGGLDSVEAPRINIVLNWFTELRERVPVD